MALKESLHFLAGVLTMLPFLNAKTREWPVLKSNAEKLLMDGHELVYLLPETRRARREKREESAAAIRRFRKHEEKIERIVQKIERAARKK